MKRKVVRQELPLKKTKETSSPARNSQEIEENKGNNKQAVRQ